MGFPEWTLWGMGLSVAGALITITLSWLGQSPQMLRRLGLSGARLHLRVRAFTGYALALLLLSIAFFLAGVPLGSPPTNQTSSQQSDEPDAESVSTTAIGSEGILAANDDFVVTPATPETGAFSGPPSSGPSPSINESTSALEESSVTRLAPSASGSGVFTATSNSTTVEASPTLTAPPAATATPIPTNTPLPTLTPTTIAGESALVSTGGSTLWLKRSPGGQNLVLVRDGDIVLIRNGRANQGGILWREVATVAGVEGWLQDEFLLASSLGSSG